MIENHQDKFISEEHQERKKKIIDKLTNKKQSIEERIDGLENKVDRVSDQVIMLRHELQEFFKYVRKSNDG